MADTPPLPHRGDEAVSPGVVPGVGGPSSVPQPEAEQETHIAPAQEVETPWKPQSASPGLSGEGEVTAIQPGGAGTVTGTGSGGTSRYRILHEIARGGMGCVFAAYDASLDREVALKTLLRGSGNERFVREAKITARLPHPGIPPVYELGTLDDGSPFLAMKLIAGHTLIEELRTATRPRLLQMFLQICQAVGFANSRGIIHRDLKPANIMVGAFGEVQVMDWGLAKDLTAGSVPPGRPGAVTETDSHDHADPATTMTFVPGADTDADQTVAGAILGTPAYMAPEQARGEPLDARADVFGLGGILCAILTGAPPFRSNGPKNIIRMAADGDLSDASARLDSCGGDRELVELCRSCLAARPADRPADAREVADAMTAYLAGVQERLQQVERDQAVEAARAIELRKRGRVQRALVAAVAAIVLGGLAAAWWQERQAGERAATEARLQGERDAEERARRQQARDGIAANLRLATELRSQFRFPAAEASLALAQSLAVQGAPDQIAEVEGALKDLEMVRTLDDIRYRKLTWVNRNADRSGFQTEIAPPEYRHAFARYGIDVTTGSPADNVAAIQSSSIRTELVAALDDWQLYEENPQLAERLLLITREADPGAWTDRLRDPQVRSDREKLNALVADVDLETCSPTSLTVLSSLMLDQRLNPIELLSAAHNRYPDDFELAFTLGQFQTKVKAGLLPVGPYLAARAVRPQHPTVWLNLGSVLADQGELQAAMASYQQGLALDPSSAVAHYNVGTLHQKLGREEEALRSYRQALELEPGYAEALNNVGSILLDRGKQDEAQACFQSAVDANPKLVPARYNLALLQMREPTLEAAIANFRRVIELDPRHARAHYDLGVALGIQGKEPEAFACYQKAVELDPRDGKALVNLGNGLRARGRLDEALASFRLAIEIDPTIPQAHYGLGIALLDKPDPARAIASLRRAVQLDPHLPGLQFDLGTALYQQGKLDEAQVCLQAAVVDDPDSSIARTNLGNVMFSRREFEKALALYRESLKLDASNPITHLGLGNALAATGAVDEAVASYRQAIVLRPDFAYPHGALGQLLLQKGRLKEARESTARALALIPKSDPLHGAVQKQLEECDRAIAQVNSPEFRARDASARRDWQTAANLWKERFATSPIDNGEAGFEYAATLLLAGDETGYRAVCAQLLERSGARGIRPYHVARACTLAAGSVPDGEIVEQKSEGELTRAASQHWALTEQAALACRAGRTGPAIDLLEKSLAADGKPGRAVVNWLWLARTHLRNGDLAAARMQRDKAAEWLDQLPETVSAKHNDATGWHLHNWLEALLLRREVDRLLEEPGDAPR